MKLRTLPCWEVLAPVSYTHLDVYKRQIYISFHVNLEFVSVSKRWNAGEQGRCV